MSYLGLNLDSLVWEIKALMKNNYGPYSKEEKERFFENAEESILKTFKDIINQNKEIVLEELEGEE